MHPHFRERFDVVADVLELAARTYTEASVELARSLLGPISDPLLRSDAPDSGLRWERFCAIDHRPTVSSRPGQSGSVAITREDIAVIVESILVCFREEIELEIARFQLVPVDLSLPPLTLDWLRALVNTLRRIVARRQRDDIASPTVVMPSAEVTPKPKRKRTAPEATKQALADAFRTLHKELGLHGYNAKYIEERFGIPASTVKDSPLWDALNKRRRADPNRPRASRWKIQRHGRADAIEDDG